MRRALLTARAPALAFTVGNPAISRPDIFTRGYVLVPSENPAPYAGTLTTINYYANAAGPVTFLTGTGTTTFTVTAVSSSVSAAAGANTFTVSLPIAAGGRVALWSPSSGGARSTVKAGGGTMYYLSSASVPTAGASLSMTLDASMLSLEGIGT